MTRRAGVLLSGSGRSLQNLFDTIDAKALGAEIVTVISSDPAAFGLARARRRGVPADAVVREPGETLLNYSERIFAKLDAARADLAVLAGFLKIIEIPNRYIGKIMNIHPALLPAFGGKGLFGDRVHAAVLASGARISGCTVHYVTNDVDAGPIIVQRAVEVRDGDTVEALAARVFEEEKIALPEAIELHFSGILRIEGLRVVRADKI